MDSLKKLAAAVLVRALVDAQKDSTEARKWLLKDDSTFPFWCRVSGRTLFPQFEKVIPQAISHSALKPIVGRGDHPGSNETRLESTSPA